MSMQVGASRCMCVFEKLISCVCVCIYYREREKGRERGDGREREREREREKMLRSECVGTQKIT